LRNIIAEWQALIKCTSVPVFSVSYLPI